MAKRECGDCTLCCKCLSIVEIDKPGGEWCPHSTPKGCSIYETRPLSCVEFTCAWREGILPEGFRPNYTHVVFTLEGLPDYPVICCYEDIEGIAMISDRNKWCIEHFRTEEGTRVPIGIISPSGYRTILDENLNAVDKYPPHPMFTLGKEKEERNEDKNQGNLQEKLSNRDGSLANG